MTADTYINVKICFVMDCTGSMEPWIEQAKTRIVEITDGESFGEQAFLQGGVRGATAQAKNEVSCIQIASEDANQMLSEASPLWVPVFEALLLQQNMHNALRSPMA